MKVILISGKAQHGKDTVSGFLRDGLKSNSKKVLVTHYADLLKYICTNYFGWNGIKDDNGRHLLQYVGTDVIRKKNPSMWVDFVSTILKYFRDSWEYVIIPDCRFPNEITNMKDSGFDTVHIRVVRSEFNSPLTEEQQQHESETALDNTQPDILIENSGDLDQLESKINKLINEVFL